MQGATAVLVLTDTCQRANRTEGRAELTADFGTDFIAGRTCEQTEITNGVFSGIVDPVRENHLEGTYDGLVVAEDGNEAIGSSTFVDAGNFPVYGIIAVAGT